MKLSKNHKEKKVRVTLDLSNAFYERLSKLERLVEADTKSSLIRQALQLYEFVSKKSADGYSFRLVTPDGKEQDLVFFDIPTANKSPSEKPLPHEELHIRGTTKHHDVIKR